MNPRIGFIVVLLLVIAFFIPINVVGAVHNSVKVPVGSTAPQKTMSITTDVLGINVSSQYAVTAIEYEQGLYLNTLPQESLRWYLESKSGNSIDARFTYANGTLRAINILGIQGSPNLNTVTGNIVEDAENLLFNYQKYTKSSVYGQMAAFLNQNVAAKNHTTTVGSLRFEEISQQDAETFKWTYTQNGMIAPEKCVTICYEKGFLSYFIDNWDLYEIGNANSILSESDAKTLAITNAKSFTWMTDLNVSSSSSSSQNYSITGFKVANAIVMPTALCSSLYVDNERDSSPLTLYPMRQVWVSLDKFYPGNVYGINVYIWADTKQVCYIHEQSLSSDPPQDKVANSSDYSVVKSTTVQAAYGFSSIDSNVLIYGLSSLFGIIIWLNLKRHCSHGSSAIDMRKLKKMSVLLLFLLSSSIILTPVSMTVATPLNGTANIWGAESSGARWYGSDISWRKTPGEVQQQRATSAAVGSIFSGNGYNANDLQGNPGSNKDNILSQISNSTSNSPRVAIVDFDHGNGLSNIPTLSPDEFHFMFEDNYGTHNGTVYEDPGPTLYDHAVFDMDIFSRTYSENTFFVLINACNSAYVNDTWPQPPPNPPLNATQGIVNISESPQNWRGRGMPFAWTHRYVKNTSELGFDTFWAISNDGYHQSDGGKFCYMGFYMGSAALEQHIVDWNVYQQNPGRTYGPFYHLWLEDFFNYALSRDETIHQALNDASQDYFGMSFDLAPLYGGFASIWPMYCYNSTSHNYEWQTSIGVEVAAGQLKVYGNADLMLYQPLVKFASSDMYGNQLSTQFIVDGNSVSDGASVRMTATDYRGAYHTVSVSDVSGYVFDHYLFNDEMAYSTQTVNMSSILSDCNITACYRHVGDDLSITVGGSCALYPVLHAAAQAFPTYYDSLNIGHLDYVNVFPRGDNDDAFQGVLSGTYDIGMMDRTPSANEWGNLSNAQLWAVGYNGTLPPPASGTPLDPTRMVWMLTDHVPLSSNCTDSAVAVFISKIRRDNTLFDCVILNATRPGDFAGFISNATNQNQTQLLPDGIVNFEDVTYFVDSYIKYLTQGKLNPYGDMTANGVIDFDDVTAFVAAYIDYYKALDKGGGSLGGGDSLDSVPAGALSAVRSGTANVSEWQVGPYPNPINSTVKVDIRIDNASCVWGWHTDVNWTASTLQLVKVEEGSYLSGCDATMFLGGGSSLFDNANGTVKGGLSCVLQADPPAMQPSGAGVLATLWFNVTAPGTANVTLSGAKLTPGAGCNSTDTQAYNATIHITVPVFCDDFEQGSLSGWDSATGDPPGMAPTISTAKAHLGNHSAYLPAKTDNEQQSQLGKSVTLDALNFRVYVNFASVNGSGYFDLLDYYTEAYDNVRLQLNLAQSKFKIFYLNAQNFDMNFFYSSTVNVTANTWHCIELSLNSTGCTLYYDGAQVLSGTFHYATGGAYIIENIYSTKGSATYAPAFYIDDAVIAQTYIGP